MNAASGKAKEIFVSALKLPADQWDSYLAEACGGDDELRKRVRDLLHANAEAGSFLEPPAAAPAVTVDHVIREGPGTIIGPYKLLEQIGEGGMGLVFMAEQQQPVRRKVALKILKPGMDTRHVIARFEAERQALALMDHPNIARVLDAGETASGRPHFVMELVRGVSITDFCDQNRLSTRERLELFAHVCQAVQHAHHKGIIHRDIKPSNVMVTLHDAVPVVKVIDFGIAKALGQQLTEKTLYTGFAQMIGTPMYMSPEQAQLSGLDIDTRSDIYSLGVLLYELLTGMTPFDKERLSKVGYDEMRRIIREEEPPRPSKRLSTLGQATATASERRQSDPRRLSLLLRGELDWIAMKALEKDRNRRYETASAFAADVQRYLHDEPVLACPPSAWYRCRKFTRRHKVGLRIAAATALVLLLAIAGVSWTLWDQAKRRTETEQTVSAALIQTEEWRRQADEVPVATRQQADAVLVLWRQAAASLTRAETAVKTGTAGDRLHQQVLDVQEQIERGRTHAQQQANLLHDLDEARMTRTIWLATHFDYAGAARKYAAAFAAYGLEVKPGRTAELAQRIRAEQRGVREALIVGLDNWAEAAAIASEEEANASKRELAKRVTAVAAAADDDPWRRRFRAAEAVRDRAAMLALSREALRLSLQPSSVELLALRLSFLGEREEALALLRWAHDRYLADFEIHYNLGVLLTADKEISPLNLEEAIGCFRAALARRPTSSAAHNSLGQCFLRRKQVDAAIRSYSKAIELNSNDAPAWSNRGSAYVELKQWDKALADLTRAIDIDPKFAEAHNNLGRVLGERNEIDNAMAEFHKAIKLDPRYAPAHGNLGRALHEKKQLNEAIAEYEQAIKLDPHSAAVYVNLGTVLMDKKELDEAKAAYKKAIELDPDYAPAHYGLGNALRVKNRLDDAVAAYKKAIALQPDYAEAHCNLGQTLRFLGQLSASLDFLKRGHALGNTRTDWHYKSAQWVADAERLVRLEASLADVLAGKATAADNQERLGFLEVCGLQRRHAAAARVYADAFTADPKLADDLKAMHRYDAACYAVLAAAGFGTDAGKLDVQERRRLRQQALTWLRADLEQWSKRLEDGKREEREIVRAKLEHWQRDDDLAGLRDPQALKKLSAEEQKAWGKLWADVAELRKKAGSWVRPS